jgi:hypothetical protein
MTSQTTNWAVTNGDEAEYWNPKSENEDEKNVSPFISRNNV